MNIAARIAIVAGATAGAGALAWKFGNSTPEPLDDGITRRELAPALGMTAFGAIGGAILAPTAWLLAHAHQSPGMAAPKIGVALLVGAVVGVAAGAGFGFGLAASESYDYPAANRALHI